MSTWSQIVNDALKLLGVYEHGASLDADHGADGLRAAQLLLETWSNERLSVFTMREITHSLTSGTGTYYIGRGGDINETTGTAQAGGNNTITLASGAVTDDDEFNDFVVVTTGGTGSGQHRTIIDTVASTDVCTVSSNWDTNPDATTTYEIEARRPQRIHAAFTRDSDNQDFPISVGLTNEEWSLICKKSLSTTYPNYLYYRESYPRGEINLYPAPGAGLTLYLQVWDFLTRPGALTSTVVFPPGYERAFIFNLAVDMAPMFGVEPSPTVQKMAVDSKAALQSLNQKYEAMCLDVPVGRRVNYRQWFFSGS